MGGIYSRQTFKRPPVKRRSDFSNTSSVFPQRRNKQPERAVHLEVASHIKKTYPHVKFISDFAAGMQLSKPQATLRARLNSGRGWSDIFLAYPSRGYHGLFLELKKDGVTIYVTRGPRKGELVADEQIVLEAEFLLKMNDLGYCGRFGVGAAKAIAIIDWYMCNEQPTLF